MNLTYLAGVQSIDLRLVIGASVAILIAFFIFIKIVKAFLFVCAPNQMLVFSGRSRKVGNKSVGYRVVFTGRAFRWPIIEEVGRLDLRIMDVHLDLKNAYAKGGIPLNVEAVANVKITSDPDYIHNAVERFLGKDRAEIQMVCKDTLEGHLRGVIAMLTPEQMNEDRLTLMERLADEAEEDLKLLGLHLDTFNIHQIADERGYLDAIGREKIAIVAREVEVAKSNADREASESESNWLGRANVARENASTVIAEQQNAMRKVRAELEARAKSEEERAQANARAAAARAGRSLQEVRAELEKLRLEADVVCPAEAKNVAKVFESRGDAAPQAARGVAMAESLGYINEVWKEAGEEAKTIYVLQRIETILGTIVDQLDVEVDEVNLVDDGSGQALPTYIASYPASVTAVLNQLNQVTGLDLRAALTGSSNGNGSAAGAANGGA